jgi:hypothetical protein
MRHLSIFAVFLGVSSLVAGCSGAPEDEVEADVGEVKAGDVWVHLDANTGLTNATLTVVNGGTVKCPNGVTAKTCTVKKLVLPQDCGWECQDGLLGHQGEAILHGAFVGTTFVADRGLDTFSTGLGKSSIYVLSAAPSCATDPCPATIDRKKINSSTRDVVTALDFSGAVDPNFVLDPMLGYGKVTTPVGLFASGRVYKGVFKVDRVFRLETPKPACDPQLVARAHAYGDPGLVELRTVYEAERAVDPNGESVHWMVRTAETPTTVTFTSGVNDLWAEKYRLDKATCAITTLAEH